MTLRSDVRVATLQKDTPDSEEHKIEKIRNAFLLEYDDLLQPVPSRLPPIREISHTIPLIDEKKRYTYRLPKCPDALKGKLLEKIERYTAAGWWEPAQVEQAAPLLCIYKKDGGLRTVVDLRQRNENTVKDVTPFPDQDQIRNDFARARYRTKLDMSDAYEQIRIADADVWKTSFATIYGTFISRVTQQGDCNAPSTFQRLMVFIFRSKIGICVHVYLDDVFIFSDTLEEHVKHLRWVLDLLRKFNMHLSRKKCDILSKRIDCLGHIVDDQGLHADTDKMSRIRNWHAPRNYHEVQQFLGLVQYLAHFMPDVTAYTAPLSSMTRNGQSFSWRPLHDKCFETIKILACKAPILKPIDPNKREPIWLITDASVSGVGAVYGQGHEWQTCRPAGFMSKRFTSAQHSYFTYEQEALGALEALLKWEDKLIGRHFKLVTDHKALTFLSEKKKLPGRIERWVEYLARFDFEIIHVPGESNKVADALSRYFTYDPEGMALPSYDLVTADIRLDPDGETLPDPRIAEMRAQREMDTDKGMEIEQRQTADVIEPRRLEAEELRRYAPKPVEGSPELIGTDLEDPVASQSQMQVPELPTELEGQFNLKQIVKRGQVNDAFCAKILKNATDHKRFRVERGLVEHSTGSGDWVLCIPNVLQGKKKLTQVIMDHAHSLLGHLGNDKTNQYLRRWVWWPSMSRDIERFCATCAICQTTKVSNQKPLGLLHNLPVPVRPWQSISMDFVGPFPECDGFDYLWVVVCRMTATTHLVPMLTTTKASELAWLFLKEITKLHGVPDSIVSDRDPKFTSKFWREFTRLIGTKLLMSTAFHPQTDGMSERTIRTVTQILRAMVQPDQTDWVRKVPMVEFAINSSASSTTGFAPFELNYGYMPTMMRALEPEPALPGVKEFAEQAIENVRQAHDSIITSRVSQTHHANKDRRSENNCTDPDFEVGKKAYLSTQNLALPKGRARKLTPRYIGPYNIIGANAESSAYTLELPHSLRARGIYPTFHVSRLRRHEPNDSTMFPDRDVEVFYDFGNDPEDETLVDEIVAHEWSGRSVRFLVRWDDGDTTWESWSTVKDLEAIDRYFELLGVQSWKSLPKGTPEKRKKVPAQSRRKIVEAKGEPIVTAAEQRQAQTSDLNPQNNDVVVDDVRGRGHRVRKPSRKVRESR